jgi:hypothetical protein
LEAGNLDPSPSSETSWLVGHSESWFFSNQIKNTGLIFSVMIGNIYSTFFFFGIYTGKLIVSIFFSFWNMQIFFRGVDCCFIALWLRNIFLMDLGAIPLKCKHQEDSTLLPPHVSVRVLWFRYEVFQKELCWRHDSDVPMFRSGAFGRWLDHRVLVLSVS